MCLMLLIDIEPISCGYNDLLQSTELVSLYIGYWTLNNYYLLLLLLEYGWQANFLFKCQSNESWTACHFFNGFRLIAEVIDVSKKNIFFLVEFS